MVQSSKSSTAGEAKLHPSSTLPPFVPSVPESAASHTTKPEGPQTTVQREIIQPSLQNVTSISMDLTSTVLVEESANRTGQACPTVVTTPSTRIQPMPTARGRKGVHTTLTTVTHTTPISQEASQQDALETSRRMLGTGQTESTVMQGMGLGAVVSEEQRALSQRNISSEDADPIPVVRAEPMLHDLSWH